MTVIYEEIHLEDRSSKRHKIWKGFHLVSYSMAIIVGMLNFYFFYILMQTFDDNCVLYPNELIFENVTRAEENVTKVIVNMTNVFDEMEEIQMLNTDKSFFQKDSACDVSLYTPILSFIFGMIWFTMFTVCPSGGYSRHGLPQPWRVLTPALIFAIVFACITLVSFNTTDNGLKSLCIEFNKVTYTNSCTPLIDEHIITKYNTNIGPNNLIQIVRSFSAGIFIIWTLIAVIIIIRCILGPDFQVKKVFVKLLHPDGTTEDKMPTTEEVTSLPDTTMSSLPTMTVAAELSPQSYLRLNTDSSTGLNSNQPPS